MQVPTSAVKYRIIAVLGSSTTSADLARPCLVCRRTALYMGSFTDHRFGVQVPSGHHFGVLSTNTQCALVQVPIGLKRWSLAFMLQATLVAQADSLPERHLEPECPFHLICLPFLSEDVVMP